jgi:FAD binding domain of DNA photolyase
VAEGWLSNRARLIVGSFLTKTLGVDWKEGAIHFERLLVDGDLPLRGLRVRSPRKRASPAVPARRPLGTKGSSGDAS